MTGAEVAAIITSLATLVAAIGGLVLGIMNRSEIQEVKHNTNSLALQMQESEHGRGLREGRAAERAASEGAPQ